MLNKKINLLWSLALIAILTRLITLHFYPLMDTTESRYGEIARLMAETNNWLTPMFDYDTPFWGKPPLFAWMSASSIKLFGLSEFALRLPHWLAGIVVLIVTGWFTRKNGYSALVASTVLATTVVFSISAGAVMTDMALTVGITLSMIGFYQCWRGHKIWGYVGFIGLAIGLLAKGPMALVLFSLATVPWMIVQHGLKGAFLELWRRFPIIKGAIVMLAIALPWYLMAEQATPGFIDYFIVGEHYSRFVESGWSGDLYGSAHQEPKGKIWVYWVLAGLPWSLVLPFLLVTRRVDGREQAKMNSGLSSFALWWLLAPLLLFTMSSNILPTYVLPSTPALALLIAIYWKNKDTIWLSILSLIVPVALIAAVLLINNGVVKHNSDIDIFNSIEPNTPTFYVTSRPHSGQYYSKGKAKQLTHESQLDGLNTIYVIAAKEQPISKESALHAFHCETEPTAKSQDRLAFRCSR